MKRALTMFGSQINEEDKKLHGRGLR